MIVGLVVLGVVCLVLALAAGFGFGVVYGLERSDAAICRRTLAQLEQVNTVGNWAAHEIGRHDRESVTR